MAGASASCVGSCRPPPAPGPSTPGSAAAATPFAGSSSSAGRPPAPCPAARPGTRSTGPCRRGRRPPPRSGHQEGDVQVGRLLLEDGVAGHLVDPREEVLPQAEHGQQQHEGDRAGKPPSPGSTRRTDQFHLDLVIQVATARITPPMVMLVKKSQLLTYDTHACWASWFSRMTNDDQTHQNSRQPGWTRPSTAGDSGPGSRRECDGAPSHAPPVRRAAVWPRLAVASLYWRSSSRT